MKPCKKNLSHSVLQQQLLDLGRPRMKPHVAANQGNQLLLLHNCKKFVQTGGGVTKRFLYKQIKAVTSDVERLFDVQVCGSGNDHEVRRPIEALVQLGEAGNTQLACHSSTPLGIRLDQCNVFDFQIPQVLQVAFSN